MFKFSTKEINTSYIHQNTRTFIGREHKQSIVGSAIGRLNITEDSVSLCNSDILADSSSALEMTRWGTCMFLLC